MNKVNAVGSVVLVLFLGCGGSDPKSNGPGGTSAGGQGGNAGGAVSGSMGTIGGTSAAASNGVAGATTSTPVDAGIVHDAAPDGCRFVVSCDLLPSCPSGQKLVTPPCACPTCVDPDAGVDKDAAPGTGTPFDACPRLTCPMSPCPAGTMTVAHECGCPTCESMDAGADAGKLLCTGLSECACSATLGCTVISNECYCRYPQCGASGACNCGGGLFLGCVPTDLSTCAAAKARVASLCPSLSGSTFDELCQASDGACVTKCLNEVNACSDISCSMCEACDCVTDAFMRCRVSCRKVLSPGDAG